MRDLQIIINPSEITAGTRGSSLGPDAVMTAARKKGNYFFAEHPSIRVEDENRMLDRKVKFKHARRIEGLVKIFDKVSNALESSFRNDKFPFILASDHGSAGGTIAGIKEAYPNKRLGVIWIDAHGDLHSPYTTPSGNMHGMPLATALGIDNESQGDNEPHEIAVKHWETLKGKEGKFYKLHPDDLVFIGVRDTEAPEDHLIKEYGITNHEVKTIRAEGVATIVQKTLDQLSNCDMIYVSFDVDSMDPALTSHGTGTPVPFGLTPVEAREFLCAFGEEEKLVCMEFVEVNPCLDENVNKMAEITFDLFEAAAESIKK